MPQATVKIQDKIKQVTYSTGQTVLDILKAEHIFIDAPCNGTGKCGKCKVKFFGEDIPLTAEEKEYNLGEYRLACMLKPSKDFTVEVSQIKSGEGFVTADFDFTKLSTPAIKKILKRVYAPTAIENKTWTEKYENAFGELDFEILQNIKPIEGNYLGIFIDDKLVAIVDEHDDDCYAIAVDIGTTTIIATLFDVNKKLLLNTKQCINPQIKFGADVVTRISAAIEDDANILKMQHSVISAIQDAVDKMIYETKINANAIYEIVFSANSVMNHLLLGINPKSLGIAPYKNMFDRLMSFPSAKLNLKIGTHTQALILPSISSYIGADIVSGINFIEIENAKRNTLFIDIGTNTELVLKHEDKFFATSCAAGSALEGMNISCGSRAQNGAVEDITFDNKTGEIHLKVIGDTAAKTICGSGILALVREALHTKLIDKRGRLVAYNNVCDDDVRKKFLVNVNGETFIKVANDILVSKKDIRNVQLSKTAILSGIQILLYKFNLKADELDEIIIAGQFGNHLTRDMLLDTGFLPPVCAYKITYAKNTSLGGAIASVFDISKRNNLMPLKNKIEFSDLSLNPEYQKFFIESSYFPEYL